MRPISKKVRWKIANACGYVARDSHPHLSTCLTAHMCLSVQIAVCRRCAVRVDSPAVLRIHMWSPVWWQAYTTGIGSAVDRLCCPKVLCHHSI